MTTRLWASVIIFISSYSPLALILLIKDFDWKAYCFHNPLTSAIIVGISVLSVLFLFLVMHQLSGTNRVTITRISNRSNELVNYTIPYMISFFGFDLGDPVELYSFAIFMMLMCFLTIRTQSLFVNPILALRGYGLYDAEFQEKGISKEGILLSKEDLKVKQDYLVQRLSKFFYLATTAQDTRP